MIALLRSRRGAALVEYALVIAGVALVAAAAVTIFGEKTNQLVSGVGAVLPGAHNEDNAAIVAGRLLEVRNSGTVGGLEPDGALILDGQGIRDRSGTRRFGNNIAIPIDVLIIDRNSPSGTGDISD